MHCFVGNLFRCRPKSAKNYKIRLKFYKAISIYHQAHGNVQFFGPSSLGTRLPLVWPKIRGYNTQASVER